MLRFHKVKFTPEDREAAKYVNTKRTAKNERDWGGVSDKCVCDAHRGKRNDWIRHGLGGTGDVEMFLGALLPRTSNSGWTKGYEGK